MSANTLFGNRVPPACEYCEFAFPAGRKEFRVCRKKGIVQVDDACRHYRYDPLARVPRRPLELETFEAEEFSLDEETLFADDL